MFRRFAPALIGVAAAAALAFGVPAAAHAGTAPPSPSSNYGDHHKHMQRHCEVVELTGRTTDQDGKGSDVGIGYAAPNDQKGDHQREGRELVEVFQLAEVCETGEQLQVFDISRPYVQESENGDHHGDQYGQPSSEPTSPAPYAQAS